MCFPCPDFSPLNTTEAVRKYVNTIDTTPRLKNVTDNIKGTEKDRYTYKVTTIEPNHLNTIPLTGPDLIYDDTIDEIEFDFEIKSLRILSPIR